MAHVERVDIGSVRGIAQPSGSFADVKKVEWSKA